MDDLNRIVLGEEVYAYASVTTKGVATDAADSDYKFGTSDKQVFTVEGDASSAARLDIYAAGTATLYVYDTDGETVIGQKEITVTEDKREFDHLEVTDPDSFDGSISLAYVDGYEGSTDGTDLKASVTVWAYDTYGDKWDASASYEYSNYWFSSITINGTSFDEDESVSQTIWDDTTDEKNVFAIAKCGMGNEGNNTKMNLGYCTFTFDTTNLPEGWADTYGSSFKISCTLTDAPADSGDAVWTGSESFTVTVENVSGIAPTYSVSVSGIGDSYDLTREYAEQDGGTMAWQFTDSSGAASIVPDVASVGLAVCERADAFRKPAYFIKS